MCADAAGFDAEIPLRCNVCENAIPNDQTPDEVTPWVFHDPVAPPIAAARQGVELRMESLVESVQRVGNRNRWTLVEGAGGLLCPLTERETFADFFAHQYDKIVREQSLDLRGDLSGFEEFQQETWNFFRYDYGKPDLYDQPSPLSDQLRWLMIDLLPFLLTWTTALIRN